MSLEFYTDTHIPKQVAIQLRARQIEVVRCEEVGMAEASDLEHLEYAAQNGFSLITKDDDFPRLHTHWMATGRQHMGIFFCLDRHASAIGKIVSVCVEHHAFVEGGAPTEQDIHNRLRSYRGYRWKSLTISKCGTALLLFEGTDI